MAAPTEEALRVQLTEQYQHVEKIGLNELASGNLSCRLGTACLFRPLAQPPIR